MSRPSKLARARAALVVALGPEHARSFEANAPELVDLMAEAIVAGDYTPAEGAEALVVCNELADATDRGEITQAEGSRLVELDALRQSGRRRAD